MATADRTPAIDHWRLGVGILRPVDAITQGVDLETIVSRIKLFEKEGDQIKAALTSANRRRSSRWSRQPQVRQAREDFDGELVAVRRRMHDDGFNQTA